MLWIRNMSQLGSTAATAPSGLHLRKPPANLALAIVEMFLRAGQLVELAELRRPVNISLSACMRVGGRSKL